MVNAGATLVIGNHPHIVQGVGRSRMALCRLLAGNFVFDQAWFRWDARTHQKDVMWANFQQPRSRVSSWMVPIHIYDDLQPRCDR